MNLEIWKVGLKKSGNLEIWKSANLEIWKVPLKNLEIWKASLKQSGNLEICESGNLEIEPAVYVAVEENEPEIWKSGKLV